MVESSIMVESKVPHESHESTEAHAGYLTRRVLVNRVEFSRIAISPRRIVRVHADRSCDQLLLDLDAGVQYALVED